MPLSKAFEVTPTALSSASPAIWAHTNRLLDLGIIAAGFGIFVSLTDFFLTSEQKKRAEDFIDNLTLRLDYTKTLDWLQKWLHASRRASVVKKVFIVFAVSVGILISIFVIEYLSWWNLVWIVPLTPITWIFVTGMYKRFGVPIIEWLADCDSYGELISNYLVVILGGGVALSAFAVAVFLLAEEPEGGSYKPVQVIMFASIVLGLVLCWFGIVIDGLVTMIGALILFILRMFVDAARWVMWRISNYPKGPLTATLTLIGAILAVAKILTAH